MRTPLLIIIFPTWCILTLGYVCLVIFIIRFINFKDIAITINVIMWLLSLLLFLACFTWILLMDMYGRVVVESHEGKCRVFKGVGSIGGTQYFKWSEINNICKDVGGHVILVGKFRYLNLCADAMANRNNFLLSALRYMKAQADRL